MRTTAFIVLIRYADCSYFTGELLKFSGNYSIRNSAFTCLPSPLVVSTRFRIAENWPICNYSSCQVERFESATGKKRIVYLFKFHNFGNIHGLHRLIAIRNICLCLWLIWSHSGSSANAKYRMAAWNHFLESETLEIRDSVWSLRAEYQVVGNARVRYFTLSACVASVSGNPRGQVKQVCQRLFTSKLSPDCLFV